MAFREVPQGKVPFFFLYSFCFDDQGCSGQFTNTLTNSLPGPVKSRSSRVGTKEFTKK